MRVKLDENLPIQFKRLFTESGHDAATVLDEGIGGATDVEIASACLAEDRVLLTQDLDFADIRAYPPSEYPGIVVFRLANQGGMVSYKSVQPCLRRWPGHPPRGSCGL